MTVLTPKEEEVVELIAASLTTTQIANRLAISGQRVRVLTSSIADKLELDPERDARVLIACWKTFGTAVIEDSVVVRSPVTRSSPVGLSPRTRFRVLMRDGFCCRYCGRQPPEVKLHVDHIVPRTAGGSNEDDNLAAACRDCNLGKGTQPLPA